MKKIKDLKLSDKVYIYDDHAKMLRTGIVDEFHKNIFHITVNDEISYDIPADCNLETIVKNGSILSTDPKLPLNVMAKYISQVNNKMLDYINDNF